MLSFSLIEGFQSHGMIVECAGRDESDVMHLDRDSNFSS